MHDFSKKKKKLIVFFLKYDFIWKKTLLVKVVLESMTFFENEIVFLSTTCPIP